MAKKKVVLTRDPFTKDYSNDKGPSTLVAITFKDKEGKDTKASCFMKTDPEWKEGTEVELDFFKSDREDKDGNPYINFTDPEKVVEKDDGDLPF